MRSISHWIFIISVLYLNRNLKEKKFKRKQFLTCDILKILDSIYR